MSKDRVEKIDVDVPDEYRGIIFDKIIKKIGIEKTARVFAIGTNQDLGAIDDIGRALDIIYKDKNGKSTKELKIEKKRIIATETNKEIRQNKVAEINSKIKEYEEYNEKIDSPYSLSKIALIKEEYKKDQDKCKKDQAFIASQKYNKSLAFSSRYEQKVPSVEIDDTVNAARRLLPFIY